MEPSEVFVSFVLWGIACHFCVWSFGACIILDLVKLRVFVVDIRWGFVVWVIWNFCSRVVFWDFGFWCLALFLVDCWSLLVLLFSSLCFEVFTALWFG